MCTGSRRGSSSRGTGSWRGSSRRWSSSRGAGEVAGGEGGGGGGGGGGGVLDRSAKGRRIIILCQLC